MDMFALRATCVRLYRLCSERPVLDLLFSRLCVKHMLELLPVSASLVSEVCVVKMQPGMDRFLRGTKPRAHSLQSFVDVVLDARKKLYPTCALWLGFGESRLTMLLDGHFQFSSARPVEELLKSHGSLLEGVRNGNARGLSGRGLIPSITNTLMRLHDLLHLSGALILVEPGVGWPAVFKDDAREEVRSSSIPDWVYCGIMNAADILAREIGEKDCILAVSEGSKVWSVAIDRHGHKRVDTYAGHVFGKGKALATREGQAALRKAALVLKSAPPKQEEEKSLPESLAQSVQGTAQKARDESLLQRIVLVGSSVEREALLEHLPGTSNVIFSETDLFGTVHRHIYRLQQSFRFVPPSFL